MKPIKFDKYSKEDSDDLRFYEFDYDGIHFKLVSVTSVLGKMLSKPALIPWAFNLGVQETTGWVAAEAERAIEEDDVNAFALSMANRSWGFTKEALKREEKGATDSSKKAMERGTYIHSILESIIAGEGKPEWYTHKDNPVAGYVDQLDAFTKAYEPEWHESELMVAHLEEEYAGTLDAVCTIHKHPPRKKHPNLVGKKVILDLKTGKDGKVYPESHYPQIAAYQEAYQYMGYKVDGAVILAVGPEKYSVGVNYYPYGVFESIRNAYDELECAKSLNPLKRK